MLTDPRFVPWRAEASKRGYVSSLVLPLLSEGRAFGALTIYSRKANGFIEDEVRLLTALAGDLAYGITALRLRAAKERAEAALLESEAQLAGLVGSAMDAILSVDAEQRIVLFNAAAEKMFGCPASAALGQPVARFIPEPLRARHRQHVQEFGSVGVTSRIMGRLGDLTALRADGQAFPIEASISQTDVRGRKLFTVILRDVTERKRAQAALQQTTEDLKRSNRDLEQFAYVASHDLQEPLRAVGGYVKLLEHRFSDKLDAKARGYIAGAFDGATRMERLIGDLLAFSRVATRGDAFLPADLEDALGQALRNLEAGIDSARATVVHDRLPSLSVDAGQVRQLFQNLIGNALKFHGEQPPKIHIGAQRQEGRWVFSVRDNGIGIEPQYYERIFQIFQRLHTRKDYPGTGIGLAICKKIVERHGGTIWVESQPGQGATFYFSIPAPPTAG
jgi:PAS domain S-box-containing protein